MSIKLLQQDIERYITQRDYHSADNAIRRVLEEDENNEFGLFYMGLIQLKTGKFTDALETYRRVISLYPEGLNARLNLGVAYYQLDDIRNAELCYEEELCKNEFCLEARYNLSTIYHYSGRYKEACVQLRRCINENHCIEDCYPMLLECYHSTGDFQSEIELCREMIARGVNSEQTRERLGSILIATGAVREGRRIMACSEKRMRKNSLPC